VKNWKYALALLTFGLLLFLSGCASTGSENVSERPWNAPQSWEYGVPGGMMPQQH
jgi:hypothetical protein